MKLIGVTKPVYDELKQMKEEESHTTFDSAIRELLMIKRYRNETT